MPEPDFTNPHLILAGLLEPPPKLKPSEWLEQNIKDIPYSPIPGGFNPDLLPAIRPVLDAILDPRIPVVVLKMAIQTIKTLALELALCYVIKNMPGPALFTQASDPEAGDEAEHRLHLLFENCPPVKDLIPTGVSRDRFKKHSVLFNHGMSLWVLGANNPRNRHRRSIRWLFCDECWLYNKDAMGELEARVTAFGWLGKQVYSSQGSEEEDDFDLKWKETNQATVHFDCPECDYTQPFTWKNVEFESIKTDEGDYDYKEIEKTALYRCERCNCEIPDTDESRRLMNANPTFVSTNPGAAAGMVGFHIPAMTTQSWGSLAVRYLRAKVAAWRGDLGPMRLFHQQRLGLTWGEYAEEFSLSFDDRDYQMGDDWEDEGAFRIVGKEFRIMEKAPEEPDKKVHRLRLMSVDVQLDHFWIVVRAFASDGRSRLVWCGKVFTWEDIEAKQHSHEVFPYMVFVDAGDKPYAPYGIYEKCAEYKWTAIRGSRLASFTHNLKRRGRTVKIQRYYSPVKQVSAGRIRCRQVTYSNLNIKDMLNRLVGTPEMFGVPADVPTDDTEGFRSGEGYAKQMESERRQKKNGKWIWLQIGKRPNHLWDCEVMITVGATMLRLLGPKEEFDWPEEAGDATR